MNIDGGHRLSEILLLLKDGEIVPRVRSVDTDSKTYSVVSRDSNNKPCLNTLPITENMHIAIKVEDWDKLVKYIKIEG